ncbi:MAG: signal peptide peptidase SppA [Richelia sp.]|nr:signal peptide peptidase SppA [Richelia sp.]CDN14499.1 Protease IV [Richelia intracellularis]
MGNFFKQTFASLIGTLLGLTIFAGVSTTGLIILIVAAATSQRVESTVKDQSVLVFDLSTKITDSEPSSSQIIRKVLSGEDQTRMSLRSILTSIDKARKDKRIVAIYLDGSKSTGINEVGFATIKEIRQALNKFRSSGKKVIAYGVNWGEKEYFLSSVADKVVLNPLGGMEINGFSSQPMFLTGALQKYGVGVQVVRVGKFKGALEPLVLEKLSPENRQQTQRLLNDMWGEWRSIVSSSRKITPQNLQAIADNQGLLLADEAKNRGLVDQIAYFDEVVTDLRKITSSKKDDKTFTQISLEKYVTIVNSAARATKNVTKKIAIVYAEGEIVDGEGEYQQIGSERFAKVFRQIRQDKDIKAVVLRINSPGGSATASEIMQREVRLIREAKPVVVSMGDVAASGGYWIATDSNRIFAEAGTVTGSIGVFGVLFNIQQLGNNNGITWDSVKTGRYADTQTLSRPKSPEELKLYQRSVNRIYNLFLNKVADGRNLSPNKVSEIAQGRVWSGTAAKDIGLVDEIGGLDAAIAYAAKQAKLGNKWEVREYPQVDTFEQRFFGKVAQETTKALGIDDKALKNQDPLTAEFHKFRQEIAVWQKMNDPKGIYTRLPFNIKIE